MADDKLVQILRNHGAAQWNIWRERNPRRDIDLTNAPLEGADLSRTNLEDINLMGAVLNRANLKGANLTGANLTSASIQTANLIGANLRRADLTGASLTGADLTDADFRGANLTDANLTDAKLQTTKLSNAIVTPGTTGMKGLTEDQSAEIQFVVESDEADKSWEGTDPQESSAASNVTIVHATRIVGPASAILEILPTPNDPNFTEEHRDLLRELQRIVNELNAELGKVEDQERRLSEEPEVLKKVEEGLPVWRQTWLTFIGAAAGSLAGQGAAFSTGFAAGFIAGVLHDSFSSSADCLI